MLQALRDFMNSGKPIYGMNRGSVGFLMNEFSVDDLPARILAAQMETIRPLVMVADTESGQSFELCRSTKFPFSVSPIRPRRSE
jgi:NAD+ kinase